MAKQNKGLRIGAYRITPLGIAVILVLILGVAAVLVCTLVRPFDHIGQPEATPTPTVPAATQTPEATMYVPEATPSPSPSPSPTPAPRTATIRSLGEIAIQDKLLQAALNDNGTYTFDDMFSLIKGVIADADYTVADVEGSLGGTVVFEGNSSKLITPPSLIDTLEACGVDMLTLANDHTLDGGFTDLNSAMRNLSVAGIDYVGAAASAEEANTAKVVDINGIKVGFVAYTDTIGNKEASSDPAAAYGIKFYGSSDVAADVQACRSAGAEVVIAYVSWGEMFQRSATSSQQKMAKVLVGAGVDVIIGYNPHVIQPIYWLELEKADGTTQRTLCLCATGNFLSDSRKQYSDSGVIFEFTIQEKADRTGFEIVDPKYIPTYVWAIDNEDGTSDFRVVAAGEWRNEAPEGMGYAKHSRLKEVWAEAQSILGTDIAAISAN